MIADATTAGVPAGAPEWLATAVTDTVTACGHAATRPDPAAIRDGMIDALRRFSSVVAANAREEQLPACHYALAISLAFAQASAGRLVAGEPEGTCDGDDTTADDSGADGTDGTDGTERLAAITVVDARTGRVVDDPDAELTNPDARGVLTAGRLVAAAANGDYATALAVFRAAMMHPSGPQIVATLMVALAEGAGIAMAHAAYLAGKLPPDQAAIIAARDEQAHAAAAHDEPAWLPLARQAFAAAVALDPEAARVLVERIDQEHDAIVEAMLAWIDILLTDGYGVTEFRPVGLTFHDERTGSAIQADGTVPPRVVWAGRLVAARAAGDRDTCDALLISATSGDDEMWSAHVATLLETCAATYRRQMTEAS